MLVILHSVLAAYVTTVMPTGNGARMKPWFVFSPGYWCGGGKRGGKGEGQQNGVEAVNVSKAYGRGEALKPFSLTMKSGEVTAILGHNGAGE